MKHGGIPSSHEHQLTVMSATTIFSSSTHGGAGDRAQSGALSAHHGLSYHMTCRDTNTAVSRSALNCAWQRTVHPDTPAENDATCDMGMDAHTHTHARTHTYTHTHTHRDVRDGLQFG